MREWNLRRRIGPGDCRRVRIARKKSRIPGAGCVETGHLFSQLSSKRSAYSVVKKAVEPMFGGAPGHA